MRLPALTLALLLVLAGCLGGLTVEPGADQSPETDPLGQGDAPPSVTPASDGVEVEVVDVVDGDTIKVVFPNGSRETARLLGVDTPEIHGENSPGEFEGVPDSEAGAACLDRWAERASKYAKNRLLGETVTISFDENEPRRGYYGRLLVYVHDDEGEFNYGLVTRGLARVYDSDFQYKERYYAAETAAMNDGVGLWACREGGAGSTPEPSVTATPAIADGGVPLRVVEVHADAEGRDGENLNDEYVVFRNAGDEPLDISGWTVADDAGHEYTFPDGTTLAGGARLTLYTGDGSDVQDERYWGSSTPIWNNDGDTVVVRTAAGETVVEKSY
jgi:micrococcal nuclease